jgi:hypothetical protein
MDLKLNHLPVPWELFAGNHILGLKTIIGLNRTIRLFAAPAGPSDEPDWTV